MRKLLKIHTYYLFSTRNVTVIFLAFILIQVINIVFWIENTTLLVSEIERINLAWESIYTFEKLIIGLFSIFIIGNFCLPDNENYSVLFIINDYKRPIFYLFKIITISIFLLAFTLLALLFYLLIALSMNKSFVISQIYIDGFIGIVINSLIYGYITIILVHLVPTFFTIIISFILFLTSDYFVENILISTFFPSVNSQIIFSNNPILLIKLILILIFYLIISIIISRGKNY